MDPVDPPLGDIPNMLWIQPQ